MRHIYVITCIITLLSPILSRAQCPPAGFPAPGNNCVDAPILCANLDGYCSVMGNTNNPQDFPVCPPPYTLQNDDWFAFFAGSTFIQIQITPSNCQNSGNQGLQAGIFTACGPPWTAMDLQCPCTTNPFILEANNFVVGQVYYFVIDGCGGNICNYVIDVLQGSTVGVPPANPGPISGPTTVCEGVTNNYSIAPVTGATIYNWTLTPAVGTLTPNGPSVGVNFPAGTTGPVELCVTAANACYTNTTPSCYTINIDPIPTATISGSGLVCTNNPMPVDISVNFTGTGPWTFIYRIGGVPQPPITTSDNPYVFQSSQPGIYTLQSVSGGTANCVGTVSGSANITVSNVAGSAAVTPSTCGLPNGAVNLTVSGGQLPYTFMWSNSAATEDLTNVPADDYTVTVTDNLGCTVVIQASVPNNQINFNISGVTVNNTTCIGGDGSINITVTPAGSYTYEWSSSEMTEDLTNLAPGTYTVTVTTGLNCTQSASFTIDDTPNVPALNASTVPTTCELSNGSVNLTVSGGVPAYTFSWSNSAVTEDLSNVPAGTYSVTVTGANGCTNELSVTVDNNNPPINISGTANANTSCNPPGNGSIAIAITPVGSYSILWSNNEMTPVISGLAPGYYSVTVTGSGACTGTADFTVDDNPLEPNISYNVTPSSCGLPNGAINVSVSGGVPPYTFMWSNSAVTEDLINVPEGNYSVTVTGANGCTAVEDIFVNDDNPGLNINATITPNTTCNGGNGSITITVTPVGSYTYLWSNSAITPTINNLPGGSYSVTVSMGGNCGESADFFVPDEPNAPDLSATTVESTCDLPNGSVNLTVSGGVSPYTYLWSNSAATQDLANVPAGVYTVTVTGNNGCTAELEVTVDNNNPEIDISAVVTDNTSCTSPNGAINVTVFPAGTYTYQWTTSALTQDLNNLPAGTYGVTVFGQGSCYNEAYFEVFEFAEVPELSYVVTDATCGFSNGSINLSVTGFHPPYTYQWAPGGSMQDLNNIPEGLYSVTVTGANNCTAEESIYVLDLPVDIFLDAQVTPVTSCTNNDGEIELSISPSNLTISWSHTANTSPTQSNLAPGLYSVTVSAGGYCTQTADYEVLDETELPSLTTSVTPSTCGQANGSVNLQVTGGLEPYFYHWSNSAGTQNLTNVAPGTYFVTVTTAAGCTNVTSAQVVNNQLALQIDGVTTPNTSCGAPNGAIAVSVSPPGSYTYLWSNAAVNANIANLAANTYTVTVSAGGTCTATSTFAVISNTTPPNLSAVGIPSTCALANGGADATASGGTAPYSFVWTNAANTEDLSNILAGNYGVTVTDNLSCTAAALVIVANNNTSLNIANSVTDNNSCTVPNGSIDLTVMPAGGYTYLWSNSAVTEDLQNLSAGIYSVTVSAGGACSGSETILVGQNTLEPEISALITPAICSQNNGGIDLSISGAPLPYAFDWNNAAVSEDISSVLPGNYTVTVTAGNGCTKDTTLNIPNNATTFAITGVASPESNCLAANGAVDLTITPAGTYTFAWDSGQLTEDISGLSAGTYTVSVTQSGSCVASASFIIDDTRSAPLINQSVQPDICGVNNGSIELDILSGVGPFNILWDGGQNTANLTDLAPGTYVVTVTGSNDCSSTASAIVPENTIAFAIDGAATANTSCAAPNGTVNITLTPANPGSGFSYQFNWSDGQMSEDLANLGADVYVVEVTIGATCVNTAVFTVANDAGAPVTTGAVTAANCGKNTGSIDLTVTDGVGPYDYAWTGGLATEDLSNIVSGTYTVTVYAANGCTTTDAFTVPEDIFIPSLSGTPTANTSCVNPNGALDLAVSPAGSYLYTWASGQLWEDLSNITAGTFTVTVSAGGACTAEASFIIPDDSGAPLIGGSETDVLCFGQSTGSIDVTTSGGVLPFVYDWSGGILGNIEDPDNLAAGNYAVTVTDLLGCSSTRAFTIGQPASAVAVICSELNSVSAPGATDGAGTVNISGGEPPYTVAWSPGGGSQNNIGPGDFTIDNVGEGNYAVTITDANGCKENCSFSISLIGCATAVGTMAASAISICGSGCATAVYNSAGQFLEPGDIFQYVLHEGSGSQIINEIARSNQPTFCYNQALMNYETTYYISAIAGDDDGFGQVNLNAFCKAVSAGTPVIFHEIPVAGAAIPEPLNCAVFTVPIEGFADLPSATFAWTTGTGSIIGNANQAIITAGAAGLYTLIVNSFGCKDTVSATVVDQTNHPVVSILAAPSEILNCQIDEILLTGSYTGTSNPVVLTWWDGAGPIGGTNATAITQPGVYAFTLLDQTTFCTDSTTIEIQENLQYPSLAIGPHGPLTCSNPSISLTGTSPFPGISLQWATVSGTDTTVIAQGASLQVNAAGTYYLIGVDPNNNCTNAISEVVAADLTLPVASAGAPFTIDCFGQTAQLDGTNSTGPSALSFAWSTADGQLESGINTATPTISQPGTYTLTVTVLASGCMDSDLVTIAPKAPIAYASAVQPVCKGEKGAIHVDSITGGRPPFIYSIDNGQHSTAQNIFVNLDPGDYTILVTDAEGCSTTVSSTILPPQDLEIVLEPEASIKLGYEYQINTQINLPLTEIADIIWTPSLGLSCDTCLNPVASPMIVTIYQIKVTTDAGCEDRAELLLKVDRTYDIYAPNIFSPDGNGDNEVFMIFADPNLVTRIKSMRIYSRWGELVFTLDDFLPNDPANGWNGTYRGKPLNPAVFVWHAEVEFIDGTVQLFTGDVTIKR